MCGRYVIISTPAAIRALIEAGLARVCADGTSAFLSTGTRANVAIYGRCGFRVYDEADAPDDGPRVWFMRWHPRRPAPPSLVSRREAVRR